MKVVTGTRMLILFLFVEISTVISYRTLQTCNPTDCKELHDIKYHCPDYGSSDWYCRKLCKDCSDGTTYHCAKNYISPKVEDSKQSSGHEIFTDGCAEAKNCSQGEEPLLSFIENQREVENPVVYCLDCYNKNYFNPSKEKLSSTYSECSYEKHNLCTEDEHKIKCRYSGSISTSDRLCRCDARNGYKPDGQPNGETCSTDHMVTCVRFECPPAEEMLLNYACAPLCPKGQKRSKYSDVCQHINTRTEVTTVKVPTISHITKTQSTSTAKPATAGSSRKPTVQTTQETASQSHLSWVIVLAIIMIIIIVILCALVILCCVQCGLWEKIRCRHCGYSPASTIEDGQNNQVVFSTSADGPNESESSLEDNDNAANHGKQRKTSNQGPVNVITITNNYGENATVYHVDGVGNFEQNQEHEKPSVENGGTSQSTEQRGDYDSDSEDSENEHRTLLSKQGYTESGKALNSISDPTTLDQVNLSKTTTTDQVDHSTSDNDEKVITDEQVNPSISDVAEHVPFTTDGQASLLDSVKAAEQTAAGGLAKLSKCADFCSFKRECSRTEKPCIDIGAYLPNLEHCHTKTYQNCPDGYTSLETSGKDNSCLYQSISLLLFGDESLQHRLRLASTLKAVKDFDSYKQQLRQFEQDDLQVFFANMMDGKTTQDEAKDGLIDTCLQHLIMETAKLGNDSSRFHVWLLSSAINRKIEQHFQHKIARPDVEVKVTLNTKHDRSLPPFHVFWVNYSAEKGNTLMNHLVPLLANRT